MDEAVRRVELALRELWLGADEIDAVREGGAVEGLLDQEAGICDSHLHHEGPCVELGEGRLLRLAPEATDSPVRQPVHPTADAVAVAIAGIRQRQNFLIRHSIQQPEPEQIRRCPQRGRQSGFRGDGLRSDTAGREPRGHLLLNDLATDRFEVVALRARVERGRVDLDVFALLGGVVGASATGQRLLVAGGTSDGVEQRAEAGLGCEHALKLTAASREQRELISGEARERATEGASGEKAAIGVLACEGVGRCGGSRRLVAGRDGGE